MTETPLAPARSCFVISPIGAEGSGYREHADEVFRHIITPALEQFGIRGVRSDHMLNPGKISEQMFEAIFGSDLCIVVLTYANPNVYYELAVAQAACRPVIMLIEKKQPLPFDIKDFRVLEYDLSITAYTEQTYIKRLAQMLEKLQAGNWQGDDAFAGLRPHYWPAPLPQPAHCGIHVTQRGLRDNEFVLEGSFEHLPEGYTLCAARFYPKDGFIPTGTVHLDHARKLWSLRDFDPRKATRAIIALAGPDSRCLLDYWEASHSRVAALQNRLPNQEKGLWLPAIPQLPQDFVVCIEENIFP